MDDFNDGKRVRAPVAADLLYPDCSLKISDYFKRYGLVSGTGGKAKAIIAPHGAWDFSGSLAAKAFASAAGRGDNVKRVVILGAIQNSPQDNIEESLFLSEPLPFYTPDEGLFLSESDSFYTPLGNIDVDHDFTRKFEDEGINFEIYDIPHLRESSIEVLLPFVKYCFPFASIIPILMGQPNEDIIKDLANTLENIIKPVLDETLIIISYNFTCSNDKELTRKITENLQHPFSEKNTPELYSVLLNRSVKPDTNEIVSALFKSGLLDGTQAGFYSGNLLNAQEENSKVFLDSVSFT